ncbi:class I SAM-dependent methyltransferase [Pseudoxanthomonas sp. LH2527]|uniref:class I SAM-dependent methyltransferase n=1 Tax=Pseudoxanthomonas sp. LH2527 TaxID=2923249 RepID=UPI001F13E628|nr:class I SAM-dependent methyltransferase [Pseudoxanthomonas sp. LH2527]MCH6485160.1 class I SAM-dependent methyltransferase [Pseudoxanthomonas sp. LH2527]
MLPFVQGQLAWPSGPVLFLRARDGAALRQFPLPQVVCEQSFRPDAELLERAGLRVVADAAEDGVRYPLVLVLPPRQREEARALLARAMQLASPGGVVVAAMTNNEGAKSGEADLKQLGGLAGTLTKFHCRTFWTRPLGEAADEAMLQQWSALDAPRRIEGGRFLSRPGVFAWNRIDPASASLVECLPNDIAGHGADLGAGWGFLSLSLLACNPAITALDLYEAEARALALAKANLLDVGASAALGFHWHDVTAGLPSRYDFIVSNPPFHTQSRADRPDIGQRFIAAAAEALKPGGRLWLVANRHLPYEQTLNERFGDVRVAGERDGFKVIAAIKARR